MNKNEEFDFDTEFMTDEEVEEMTDSLLTALSEELSAENNRTSVVNPFKIRQVLYVYRLAKQMTKGQPDVKVGCELYAPYNSMGSVGIVGKNIVFKKPDLFIKAVEQASNFEVYPKTDGTVQINFTFHGLTTPIE